MVLGVFSKFFGRGEVSEGEGEDEDKLVERRSRELVSFVAHSAFHIFKDGEFRQQFDFSKQGRTEQDRLFNEFTLSAFCLLLFILEDASAWGREERVFFWQRVRQGIIKNFLDWFKEIGVPSKYISLWRKVIDMRHKEYKEDLPKMYEASGEADPEFIKSNNERYKESYVRLMTIAIGALHHLRRGKTSPQDPFFKELRVWLEVLNTQLEKKIFLR